jgi:3-hydroxybutyryl-CoA dehydrogenase
VTILGVVGAGTMGAGIAQLGCQAGFETRLLDADGGALERARAAVEAGVAKAAAKGRGAPAAAARHLRLIDSTDALAGCTVVIEAVPEELALKRRVLAEVAGVVGGTCVLATNTSSIPVTHVAAGVPGPERVGGMHFFNPAPVMRLVEVVRGIATSDAAARTLTELGEAMGKRVIAAADGPGFLVNRCNRPFSLEALRCLQDGLADVETIDRIVRLGGGFRMGPFELQDLVGIDTGFEVSRSFYELSFGEPRWRPSPLQARMAASGRHGRKAGRGWYAYDGDRPHRPDDGPAPAAEVPDGGLIVIAGETYLADELFLAAAEAGWGVASPGDADGEVPFLALDCGRDEDSDAPLQGGPQALLVDGSSLAALEGDGPAVGFHALPPLDDARLVELTRGPGTSTASAAAAERFFATLGKQVAWVGDAPGLVLGRIVCQLVNEAAFALGEGVGTAADIDAGMVLGLNHPRGPLEWADAIGLDHVVRVLGALHTETGEERYRLAPALRRAVTLGLTFHEDETLD